MKGLIARGAVGPLMLMDKISYEAGKYNEICFKLKGHELKPLLIARPSTIFLRKHTLEFGILTGSPILKEETIIFPTGEYVYCCLNDKEIKWKKFKGDIRVSSCYLILSGLLEIYKEDSAYNYFIKKDIGHLYKDGLLALLDISSV